MEWIIFSPKLFHPHSSLSRLATPTLGELATVLSFLTLQLSQPRKPINSVFKTCPNLDQFLSSLLAPHASHTHDLNSLFSCFLHCLPSTLQPSDPAWAVEPYPQRLWWLSVFGVNKHAVLTMMGKAQTFSRSVTFRPISCPSHLAQAFLHFLHSTRQDPADRAFTHPFPSMALLPAICMAKSLMSFKS